MDPVRHFIEKAKESPVKVVLPESGEPRILEASCRCVREKIAYPVLIGDRDEIRQTSALGGFNLDGVEIVSNKDELLLDTYSAAYSTARNTEPAVSRNVVKKPLFFAGMTVKTGNASAMVAGAVKPTSSIIQAVALTVGFQQGISTASGFFIMVIPEFNGKKNQIFLFADCALNVQPSAHQLAHIGVASGRTAGALFDEQPRVAFLSFSSKGSAEHADVDKVRQAVEIARNIDPGLLIDGELQGDTALSPVVAARKIKESAVAGMANVLIFPDLDAGNIAYKLVQYLAGAKAIGPILQGFSHPVSDLSRGATVDDIIAAIAVVSVQAQGK